MMNKYSEVQYTTLGIYAGIVLYIGFFVKDSININIVLFIWCGT
jgi:hypothetical protein